MIKIDKMHLDALKEVGNIGAGQAASGLSEVIEEKLIPAPTQVSILLRDNITDWIDTKGTIVIARFHLLSKAQGSLLLVIPMDDMPSLLGYNQQLDHLTENDLGYLKKITTIIISAYTTAISTFLDTALVAYSPTLTIESNENLKSMLTQDITENEELLLFKTMFNRSPLLTPWTQFWLIFDHEALITMLKAVDVLIG
ncbi:chemotaxis protein CheC [Candidatus Desantisbacteria bacterium]|nr:chemotaxis protein CheC [Candidatus Desantisbacteria bacterium]